MDRFGARGAGRLVVVLVAHGDLGLVDAVVAGAGARRQRLARAAAPVAEELVLFGELGVPEAEPVVRERRLVRVVGIVPRLLALVLGDLLHVDDALSALCELAEEDLVR